MGRLKSLMGSKKHGVGCESPSPSWGRSFAALCALAILVMAVGCGSGSVPSSATSAGSSKIAVSVTSATAASSTLIPVPDGKLWGYIHADGTWAIKARFDKAWHFVEGLAPVEVGGKWGYINQAGQFVLKPQFVEAYYFQNGMARVATKLDASGRGTAFGWIDKTGKFVIPPTWDGADGFYEGLAVVARGSQDSPHGYSSFGYINMKGGVVIPLKFQNAGAFSEGLAYAMSGGKWGYIDSKGSWAITPRYGTVMAGALLPTSLRAYEQYSEFGVSRFHDGYAVVWDAGKSFGTGVAHFIDKTGKQVFGRTFQAAGEFSEGLAEVEVNGKWGFIDTSGRMVIQPQFATDLDEFPGFSDGLAAVSKGPWEAGYIDKTGKWVIQPKYASGHPFGGAAVGLAYVDAVTDTTYYSCAAVIDRSGRIVYRDKAVPSTPSTSAK